MQMKNKIKDKIIQTVKRILAGLIRWCVTTATTTTHKRPIHPHSAAAIRSWLASVDHPLHSDVTTAHMGAGGGRSDEESE